MEIILSKRCESFTGSLGKGFGYHIQRRKNGFFAKRNSKGEIPANGHLRFIFFCAYRVYREELREALDEAYPGDHCALLSHHCDNFPEPLPATDVLTLKEKLNL